MRDVELYRHLLGLDSPWSVARVELGVKEQRVDVWAEHGKTKWVCPECQAALPLYDHAEERTWRHLDSCQFMTYLHARIPRVKCAEHGVRQVLVPWAEPKSRFTALFERLAIDVLRETDVLGATRILRISWDEAFHVMEKAVQRGQLRKEQRVIPRIGVDEKSAAKGHKYLTLVCDLDEGTVEHIADERKQSSLDGYFKALSPEQRRGIQAIAMDMWDPFILSALANVPDAEKKIVFDKFHIMAHMGKAVDSVRKVEHRGQKTEGVSELTGSKYLWLYAAENLPEKHRERFASLKAMNLKTGRAWAIKENLRELWSFKRMGWAHRHFARWYFWATHSRMTPVIKVAKMIKRHLSNVMSYFNHRITNAVAEGLNSKIQTIKKRAYGFRNRENFKTAIYFHCGGLDLYPAPLTHAKAG
jgi:transposase